MNLLDILGNQDGNYYFSNSGEPFVYALIGFLIVFCGIVIIIGVIWLIGFILKKTDNFAFLKKKGKKPKEETPAPQPVTETAEEEVPDEVKAAIVAAIMAYYTAEKPKCEFKVKRIKRI